MWYIYFLELENGDTYVGSTNDLRRRITSHEKGRVTSTKAYSPVTLIYYIAVQTEKNARPCSWASNISRGIKGFIGIAGG